MKIHLGLPDSPLFVRHYEKGKLTLNQSIHTESVLIHRDYLESLGSLPLDALEEKIQRFSERRPQVLLLGVGDTPHFLTPSEIQVLRPFIEKQIGIETMTVDAAARTYNILSQEGRDVMALFIIHAHHQ
jgi:uncharacterized protein